MHLGCLKNINSVVVDIVLGISYEPQQFFDTPLLGVFEGHIEFFVVAGIPAKVSTATT